MRHISIEPYTFSHTAHTHTVKEDKSRKEIEVVKSALSCNHCLLVTHWILAVGWMRERKIATDKWINIYLASKGWLFVQQLIFTAGGRLARLWMCSLIEGVDWADRFPAGWLMSAVPSTRLWKSCHGRYGLASEHHSAGIICLWWHCQHCPWLLITSVVLYLQSTAWWTLRMAVLYWCQS